MFIAGIFQHDPRLACSVFLKQIYGVARGRVSRPSYLEFSNRRSRRSFLFSIAEVSLHRKTSCALRSFSQVV